MSSSSNTVPIRYVTTFSFSNCLLCTCRDITLSFAYSFWCWIPHSHISLLSHQVLVIIDVKPKDLGLPTEAYISVEEIHDVSQSWIALKQIEYQLFLRVFGLNNVSTRILLNYKWDWKYILLCVSWVVSNAWFPGNNSGDYKTFSWVYWIWKAFNELFFPLLFHFPFSSDLFESNPMRGDTMCCSVMILLHLLVWKSALRLFFWGFCMLFKNKLWCSKVYIYIVVIYYF